MLLFPLWSLTEGIPQLGGQGQAAQGPGRGGRSPAPGFQAEPAPRTCGRQTGSASRACHIFLKAGRAWQRPSQAAMRGKRAISAACSVA